MTLASNVEPFPGTPLAALGGKTEQLAMLDHWDIPQNIYLTPEEVETRYGIARQTLANWRCAGKNLEFHKRGNKIAYPFYGRGSLSLFLKRGSKSSTSTGANA